MEVRKTGGERMNNGTITVDVETNGIDEAIEKASTLSDTLTALPAQVTIRNCRDCTINIYPSQYFNYGKGSDDTERSD